MFSKKVMGSVREVLALVTIIFASMLYSYSNAGVQAQEPGPGRFYLVTEEPVTEDNRYLGQTETIWEGDSLTDTSRQLLTVTPFLNQTPRELFPQNELDLLEESSFFPSDIIDDSWSVAQGLDRVVSLDDEHLLVVVYRQVHEVANDTTYGYYDLQLLNLLDNGLTSVLVVPYHPNFINEVWGCHIGHGVGLADIQPNPESTTFAFSVVPIVERGCGSGDLGQTYIVDYSTLPVQMEELPFVRDFSWSPDGSMLAYVQTPCQEFASEPCMSSIYTRPAHLGSPSERVFEYESSAVYRKLITWLDDNHILYQYETYEEFSDRAYWTGYDVIADRIVFDEELQNGAFGDFGYLHHGQSHLIWGWRADGLVLMRFSDVLEIVDILTAPYLSDDSRNRQYVFVGRADIAVQVLNVDGVLSTLDLTWFRVGAPNETIQYLVPGPIGEQSPNSPPDADAGPDQTISTTGDTTPVTLDGSGSTDSDGTIISYQWHEDGNLIAEGIAPEVSLAIGVHEITLTVTDDGGAADQDTVLITIESEPLPAFEPLSACWVRDWNQAQTEWHIDNPNPVPLSTNPEVKVRYNWAAYDAFDAQGSVVQAATGWDNADPNPLNTPLAKSLRLEWYLVIDGQPTDILGDTVVNADEDGQCPGPPVGSGTGLQGEYFNKKDFTRHVLTRIDPTVDFDWGRGAPAPGVQKNSFSVRWTGQVEPLYSETYTFYTVSDDGVRLWVDGQLLVDNWNNHSAHEDNGTIDLAAGQQYDLRMEYYENGGDAVARLLWSSPTQAKEVIPQNHLYSPATTPPPVGTGNGLLGRYFDEKDFTGLALMRTDAIIDFDWARNTPDGALGKDTFSIRWTGQVEPQYSETYTFYTLSDDGVRLWVDDQLLIDNWTDHRAREDSGSIDLVAGQRCDIRLEYYENKSKAVIKLLWSSASLIKQVIPQSQLYSESLTPPETGNGTGLQGDYFDALDFAGTPLTRTDATIDFDWAKGAPDDAIDKNTFSIRWTGQVEPQYSEAYTFYTLSDDGVRLWINDQLLIDNWTDHPRREDRGTIDLVAGQRYDIRLEYYENKSQAVIKLLWSSASQVKEVIPQSQLYPPAP